MLKGLAVVIQTKVVVEIDRHVRQNHYTVRSSRPSRTATLGDRSHARLGDGGEIRREFSVGHCNINECISPNEASS